MGLMKPTNETNFCRVFELPSTYPSGFCFGGGIPVTMKMVDWFNPWPPPEGEHFGLADKTWLEVSEMLKEWLIQKTYVKAGMKYLLITDFGESMLFGKP